MKNSVKDRSNAQSSCAGQFIANHLDAKWNKADPNPGADPEVPEGAERTRRRWLHVDMAGPSTDKAGRGTGYGVSLLVQLLNGELYTGAR
jgi:probable aminopeptidase NPEPL1